MYEVKKREEHMRRREKKNHPPEVRYKKGVFKNVAIFTAKQKVLESLFNKLQAFRHATLIKRNSNTGVFL